MPIKLGTIEYLKSRNLVPKNNMVGYWPLDNNANDFSENNTLNNGLLAYWKMDESSGNAADSTGNGNDLTNNNGVTYGACKINNGITPDGTNSKYFSKTGFNYGANGSVSFWFYTADINHQIIGSNSSSAGVNIQLGSNAVYAKVTADGSFINSAAISANTWYHCVFTWTGTTSRKLYLNAGTPVTTGTGSALQNGNLYVGNNLNLDQAYNGKLDELAIYDREISVDEITKLYNSGLARQYPFSWIRNNNHGTVYGAVPVPSQNPAIPASLAYKFDGTDDYISIGTDTVLSNFTYYAWVKNTNLAAAHTIKSGSYAPTGGSPQFRIETNGTLGLIKSTIAAVGYSTGIVKNLVWTSCAVSYDSSGNYKFYINGNLAGSGTNLLTFNSHTAFIGVSETSSSLKTEFMDGLIQDFAIFNKALSPQEIKSIYNASKWRYRGGVLGAFFQAFTLAIDYGTYAYTGFSIGFSRALKLLFDYGQYAYTGFAFTAMKGFGMLFSLGSYAYTGFDIAFSKFKTMVFGLGEYAYTGFDLTLSRTKKLMFALGQYAYTGFNILLRSTAWSRPSKPTSSWTNKDKPDSSIWTNQSK